jgi:serine/threonine-protein kinase
MSPERRRLSRSRWRPLALTLAGAIVGLLGFNLLIMPRFVRHGEEARVPNLHGVPGGEIEARLRSAGLRLGATSRAYDETVPMGQVTRQMPHVGARVKRGRAIDVIISLGAAAQRIPDLEGESVVHARFLLEQNGLREGRRRSVRTSDRAAEQIVAANPRSGAAVRGRATVDLLVSAGALPRRFLMPDLRGAPMDEAAERLVTAGLSVASDGGGRNRNRVRSQSPAPGSPVAAGQRVELEAGR